MGDILYALKHTGTFRRVLGETGLADLSGHARFQGRMFFVYFFTTVGRGVQKFIGQTGATIAHGVKVHYRRIAARGPRAIDQGYQDK